MAASFAHISNHSICGRRMGSCKPVSVFRASPKAVASRKVSVRSMDMIREWPNAAFVEEVTAAFPEKAIATVEEARVLYETGYTYLDVRPTLEIEETGKVKNSVNIPIQNAKWVYNAEEKKKELVKTPNPEFLNLVKRKFPKKESKLIVACSNGRAYCLDALQALDEAGYTNLVGLKGGYYAWFKVFDHKLGRRRTGEYAEQYTHNGDSCGIHSSGAGFEKVDKVEAWQPRF